MGLKKAKVSGKAVVNHKTNEMDIYLSEVEMLKMSSLIYEEKLHEAQTDLVRATIKEKILEIEKLQLECKLVNNDISSRNGRLQIIRSRRASLLKTIRDKYNITNEKFGYDPDSGKIIQ